MADTVGNLVSDTFVHELRGALRHLYDWAYLRRCPLVRSFGVGQREDAPSALRRVLIDAIEDLKPDATIPSKSKAWRTYRLLRARFTEQFTQAEVARELGLSIRHLRREETVAVQMLAAHLWRQYDVSLTWQGLEETLGPAAGDELSTVEELPSPERELEWIQETAPPASVDVGEMIQPALKIANSVAQEAGVQVMCAPLDGIPQVVAQETTIRQALVTVLTTAIRRVPGGEVHLGLCCSGGEVVISVRAHGRGASRALTDHEIERLEMARRLVALSGGSLELVGSEMGGEPFGVTLTLQLREQTPVLVIDDNVDTLQLIERYLSNSRYRFVGASDPGQALRMAEEVAPRAIVLDVMLPQMDGWELLGRLHEHPAIRGVPIIVCTILPEAQLASDLGAAAFVRKPFSRRVLLQALDQQTSHPPTESG